MTVFLEESLEYELEEFKLICFDLDGTLFNTEKYHALALEKVFTLLGRESNSKELEEKFSGFSDTDVYTAINIHTEWTLEEFLSRKTEITVGILSGLDNKEFENILALGIRHLLPKLKKNNKMLALVSASEPMVIDYLLERAGIISYFDTIVTRQDTKRQKPNPAPYLLAFNVLNTLPKDTIVFEDSKTGIAAAKSSGAKVIPVTHFTK